MPMAKQRRYFGPFVLVSLQKDIQLKGCKYVIGYFFPYMHYVNGSFHTQTISQMDGMSSYLT